MFMFSNLTWQVKKPYPLTKAHRLFEMSQDFSNYAIITFKNSFIVFGGRTLYGINDVGEINEGVGSVLTHSKIYQFDPEFNQWTELGDLKTPRHTGHGVVYVNGAFIVAGGYHECELKVGCRSQKTVETETCRFSGKLKVSTIKTFFRGCSGA